VVEIDLKSSHLHLYGKWAAIEQLKLWFLNCFGGRREVQNVTFSAVPDGPSLMKSEHGGKTDLVIEQKLSAKIFFHR